VHPMTTKGASSRADKVRDDVRSRQCICQADESSRSSSLIERAKKGKKIRGKSLKRERNVAAIKVTLTKDAIEEGGGGGGSSYPLLGGIKRHSSPGKLNSDIEEPLRGHFATYQTARAGFTRQKKRPDSSCEKRGVTYVIRKKGGPPPCGQGG